MSSNTLIIPIDTVMGPIGGYLFLVRNTHDLKMQIHYMDIFDRSSDDTIERLRNYDTACLSFNGIVNPERAIKSWLAAPYFFSPNIIVKLKNHEL